MKKYFYVLSLGLVLSMSSCDDRLDLAPFAQVSADVALVTPNDFENGVRGLYSIMRSEFYYSGAFITFPDVASDNLTFNPTGRGTQRVSHEFRYNANETQGNFMIFCYRAIQHANFILEKVANLPEGPFKENIIAEAKAVRALAHFDVNRLFSKIPTQSADANASLGLPYIYTSDIQIRHPRMAVGEFYGNLVTDLTEALEGINADNGAGRFNRNAVNALLSRVHLYTGNWSGVVTAADAVTTSVGERADFAGVWTDANDSGVIFEIKLTQVNAEMPGTYYNQTVSGEIRSEYVVSFDLFNLYQTSDVRRNAYILTGPYSGSTFNHVIKYRTSAVNASSGKVDVKVLRAAEVQLNKAEALANIGGQDAAALAALDQVRSRRYTGFTVGTETGQALKDAIQLERRLELAFEGHRFFDLKRQNLPIVRGAFGEYSDGTGQLPIAPLLAAGDCRFQFPIPKEEIDLNPNMSQNDCSFY